MAEFQIQPNLDFYLGSRRSYLLEFEILMLDGPISVSTKLNLVESQIGVSILP